MDVYFNSRNVYQPDIIFISNERLITILQAGKIKGAPDLIIEVLSPGTEKLDKTDKKVVYEKSGVREYWLISPSSKKATGFGLVGGKYIEFFSQAGVLSSRLLGVIIQF